MAVRAGVEFWKMRKPQDIPRGMEIAKKFGLEFLPPPSA
jgi:hypothetical protein